MTSFEQIIGEGIFSGDHDTALAKTTVKMMVMRHIFCRGCGNVLDQSSAIVAETAEETPIGVFCPTCWERIDTGTLAKLRAKGMRVLTWKGVQS